MAKTKKEYKNNPVLAGELAELFKRRKISMIKKCCLCGETFEITNPPNNKTGLWVCGSCSSLERKKDFVHECGKLLAIAKPNLVNCKYTTDDTGEYVIVTCENGYTYKIDVTTNSLNAIAAAIFNAMAHK